MLMWAVVGEEERMTEPSQPWFRPPNDIVLADDEVHVWKADLDTPPISVQALRNSLSEDELIRAGRFHLERDRQRFMVARGLLRSLLGSYLEADPSRLRFCYGPHGKPALRGSPGCDAGLQFNLSHSGKLAVYAITYRRRIGIDLEQIDIPFDYEALAARFFTARERAFLHAAPAGTGPERFMSCWTRKEAYLKAIGEGFSFPIDQVDVSRTLGQPLAELAVAGNLAGGADWSVRELVPAPGYLAALVVEGDRWRLQCWQWLD
jgi:4'-phosphopantetheinyl transferase